MEKAEFIEISKVHTQQARGETGVLATLVTTMISICYDMGFPEVSRTLAWIGAEVILQPTLTPTSDRDLELVMVRVNALFNQTYFVSVNGIGIWGGGRSLMVDPDGRVAQEAGTNQTILTELFDLDRVTRTRKFGTIGLAQTLKQLRDSGQKFPLYEEGNLAKGSFEKLGVLKFQRTPNNLDGK